MLHRIRFRRGFRGHSTSILAGNMTCDSRKKWPAKDARTASRISHQGDSPFNRPRGRSWDETRTVRNPETFSRQERHESPRQKGTRTKKRNAEVFPVLRGVTWRSWRENSGCGRQIFRNDRQARQGQNKNRPKVQKRLFGQPASTRLPCPNRFYRRSRRAARRSRGRSGCIRRRHPGRR